MEKARNWRYAQRKICMNAQSVLIGQKKLTCRIGAKEWFSNRFGCKDSPNGEPEYPANEPWLKYTKDIYNDQ
jgi:hypothetical protein